MAQRDVLTAVDPATGETIREVPALDAGQLDRKLRRAAERFQSWRRTDIAQRAALLRAVAQRLRDRARPLAELMAREMGKPLASGVSEAEKCAWACEHYAEHGAAHLAPQPIDTDARESYVSFQPLGVVLCVMPWNFPLWQVFRFSAPAILAGNVAVLKHASNVPGCAEAIEELFAGAGAPEGVFTNLAVGSGAVADLIAHESVAAVSVTGSRRAGQAVAAQAGQCLKKSVLELGGSDAYLVLEDADVEAAAEACARSRLVNGGQSCIAAKRFLVVEPVADAFTAALCRRLESAVVGHPMDDATDVGPLARVDLRDELHDQVRRSVDAGAELLIGGEVPDRPGAWYPVTVLRGVRKGMAAFDEETFGPVAAIVTAASEREAIELANDHAYGLGAAVFTRDVERGRRIAETELEAGFCCVNDFVRSDPRLPFGGVKDSGYGRELGEFGIREFVNVKTVYAS